MPRRAIWASGPSFSDSSRKTMPNDGIGVQKGATSIVSARSTCGSTSGASFFSGQKIAVWRFQAFRRDKIEFLAFLGRPGLESTSKLSTSTLVSTLLERRVLVIHHYFTTVLPLSVFRGLKHRSAIYQLRHVPLCFRCCGCGRRGGGKRS